MRDADNPYAGPDAAIEEQVEPAIHGTPAGKWRRFFNWLIDQLAIMLVMTVPFIAIYAIDESGWGAWLDGMARWQERLLGIAFAMLYYTALEGATGVTLGKLLTGTRVVDEEGRKPTPRQALLLSVSRMVPFEMFSVLLADDDDPRGWHDRWPRTRVVLRSRAKQVLA